MPAIEGAQPAAEHPAPAPEALAVTLGQALASGLPVTVVATSSQAVQVAASIARRDLVLVPDDDSLSPARMIARAVGERSDSAGWILLPGAHSGLKPATLRSVAEALRLHPVAYAEYAGHRGYPLGFAAGLYSDLVSGAPEDGPRRLIARYPAAAVEVDDPAVALPRELVATPVPVGAALGRTGQAALTDPPAPLA